MVCSSLEAAIEALKSPPLSEKIESVFVLGGALTYEVRNHNCWKKEGVARVSK